jgi:hypothetical protein
LAGCSGAFAEASPDTHALVKAISVQGGRKMQAQMGVDPQQAAARIKTQLIRTLGTIAARSHAQMLLVRMSTLAPIVAQRGQWAHDRHTALSSQQTISLSALARAHHRNTIGTARTGAPTSAAN